MKRVLVIVGLWGIIGFAIDCKVTPREVYGPTHVRIDPNWRPSPTAVRIDAGPDLRCITGSNARNICADTTGNNVAVLYGFTSGDPDNIMQTKIAYSTNRGAAWRLFGPFSVRYVNYRRMYGGIDARGGNWVAAGEVIYGGWHEAYYRGGAYNDSSNAAMAFDEGGFPNGSFQRRALPQSGTPDLNIWLTSVVVRPDDPNVVFFTAGDYDMGAGGPKDVFVWRSTDGGYNWGAPAVLVPGSAVPNGTHDTPGIRCGTGGYVFCYFQRESLIGADTCFLPFYIESSDNGATWVPAGGKCLLTSIPNPQYSGWWYTYDAEVINNVPYVLNSPGVPGQHRDQVEFFKASGPVGNRTWTRTLIGGNTPPGQDSIVREVNFVKGEYRSGGANSILVIAKMTTGSGTSGRVWASGDLGSRWLYWGPIGPILAAADNPLEVAKCPSSTHRPTCSGLHMVYWSGASVYHQMETVHFCGGVETQDFAVQHLRLVVEPNPFARMTSIRLTTQVPKVRDAALKICDVTGRPVKSFDLAPSSWGLPHSIIWNGRDDHGRSLPSGMYFVTLRAGTESRTAKVIIAR